MKRYLLLVVFCLNFFLINAQERLLKSGPMVAYSTMKEVMLWVQTETSCDVQFLYWNSETPEKKYKTTPIQTIERNGFIAKAIANELEPGNKYTYRLLINGKLVERPYPLEFQSQPIWKWRKDAPDFTFAIGSCAYINEEVYDRPGTPYGSNYQIFTSISNS